MDFHSTEREKKKWARPHAYTQSSYKKKAYHTFKMTSLWFCQHTQLLPQCSYDICNKNEITVKETMKDQYDTYHINKHQNNVVKFTYQH